MVDRGAVSHGAVDLEVTLALGDDALNGGETEAGTASDFLGGEERLEDPAQVLGSDAFARIGNSQLGIGPRFNQGARPIHHLLGTHLQGIGPHQELSAARHRVAGIDHQVQQHLGKLGSIRPHPLGPG
jgi:hypothetical protein